MKWPASILTPRLQLRPATLADADAIFATYAQDLDVTRYLVWRPHRDVEETRSFLRRCEEQWRAGTSFAYAILLKDSGALIGMLELGSDGGLGYVLAKAQWGQGYMVEAAGPLLRWGLGEGGLARVFASCDVDNPASARVMEKLGMRFEGRLPAHSLHPNVSAERRDSLGYAITR